MKKYNVIYADPPWSYDSPDVPVIERSVGLTEIDYYYNSMSVSDIAEMPVREISEKDSVCFMWATVPMLPEAIEVLKAWGFKYKTMLTWHKSNSKGMGYWFRGYTEHLLVGVRGNVKAFRNLSKNIYESKRGQHSQKPPYFRDLISEAVKASFPEPIKLEMFARSREDFFPDDEYEGWDVYGNQVNNSITIPITNGTYGDPDEPHQVFCRCPTCTENFIQYQEPDPETALPDEMDWNCGCGAMFEMECVCHNPIEDQVP